MSSIRSSKEPTSATAGHALTRTPTGPQAVARLAPTVATIPAARLHCGQRWHTLAAAAVVEHHHGRGPDQAVYRKRRQAGAVPDSP